RISGDWSWPQLESILKELASENPDLPRLAGFSEEEMRRIEDDGHLLYLRLTEAQTSIKALQAADGTADPTVADPGPEPPPQVPVTRLGDLWVLGEHRLLCGDSTKAEDVARVMAGEKAALVATD